MQAFIFLGKSDIVWPMKKHKKSGCRSDCPVAGALDILGDRWTLLIIRDLLVMNKHEYHEFLSGPEGIATNILSDRLKRLRAKGIVEFCPHPGHKNKKYYYLTPPGKDLLPILVELIRWGGTYHASPDMPKDRFERIKKNPKKVMRDALHQLELWEKKHLKHCE